MQVRFDDYTFPLADSPSPGGAGEWNMEEKLVQQDPLNSNVTILTSWGFRSRTRTISGVCGRRTRDVMRDKYRNKVVADYVDAEGQAVRCRIVAQEFQTIHTADDPDASLYKYTITFMERP